MLPEPKIAICELEPVGVEPASYAAQKPCGSYETR
jgi:hypothetical protein